MLPGHWLCVYDRKEVDDRDSQARSRHWYCILSWLVQVEFLTSQTEPKLTNLLFRRDQHLCLYCGKPSRRSSPHARSCRSHFERRKTLGRIVSACRRCNQFKGNKLLDETNMELLALPYTPNHAEYLALINSHRIRADQMEFLRPSFQSTKPLALTTAIRRFLSISQLWCEYGSLDC